MKIMETSDNIVVFINKELIKFDYRKKDCLEEYIKKLIIKIRKIYKLKISGSYKVSIYQNKKYGFIIELTKIEGLDFFPDLIDLKINIFYDSEVFIKIEDYFLVNKYTKIHYFNNSFYLNIDDLLNKDQLYLSEFITYIYGEELSGLKKNMQIFGNI